MVRTKDMAIVGITVGAVGWIMFVVLAPPVWKLLKVLPS